MIGCRAITLKALQHATNTRVSGALGRVPPARCTHPTHLPYPHPTHPGAAAAAFGFSPRLPVQDRQTAFSPSPPPPPPASVSVSTHLRIRTDPGRGRSLVSGLVHPRGALPAGARHAARHGARHGDISLQYSIFRCDIFPATTCLLTRRFFPLKKKKSQKNRTCWPRFRF